MKPNTTLQELRERFADKPSKASVYTIEGIAYTVVSHYAGEKDIDAVIKRVSYTISEGINMALEL